MPVPKNTWIRPSSTVIGAGLCSPFLMVGAPGGIRPLGMMAGAAPVPLAAVTQDDLHPERLLHSYLRLVQPTWPAF